MPKNKRKLEYILQILVDESVPPQFLGNFRCPGQCFATQEVDGNLNSPDTIPDLKIKQAG